MHTVGNNEGGLSFFKLEYLIHTPILFELVSAPSLLLRYDWNVGFNEIHVKNILCTHQIVTMTAKTRGLVA
jgi:hypothetical protein